MDLLVVLVIRGCSWLAISQSMWAFLAVSNERTLCVPGRTDLLELESMPQARPQIKNVSVHETITYRILRVLRHATGIDAEQRIDTSFAKNMFLGRALFGLNVPVRARGNRPGKRMLITSVGANGGPLDGFEVWHTF